MQAFHEAHIDDNDLFVIRFNKQEGNYYTAFSYLYHQLVFDYVRKNLRNEFTLNDVASLINLTPKSFCRYFKQQTTITFIDYLNRIRIQEAMRLLHKEKGKVISSIGYACGFNSASNFRKTFERANGISPTAYRMKIKDW